MESEKTGQLVRLGNSVRIRPVGASDPNAVIGELRMRPRDEDFRHVTGHAIAFADRTTADRAGLAVVTGHARCIVEAHFPLDGLVRVMTHNAADARVRGVVAAAMFQAISLEANILNTVKV